MRVGIACSAETVLHEDNWGLLEAFTSAGHEARIVIWNDPSISNWGVFDCLVVRTCWTLDISSRDNFLAWLRKVKKETILVNPYEVISWNTENHFLNQLYARGVNVVPSVLVPESNPAISVLGAAERQGWAEALVIPAILPEETMRVYVAAAPLQSGAQVSTSSTNVTSSACTTSPRSVLGQINSISLRSETSPMAASAVAAALSDATKSNLWLKRVEELRKMVGDVLVRPFIRSVLRDGSFSFVFFGGMFSHCVRRLPDTNGFVASQTLRMSVSELYMPSDECLFFAVNAYTALAATIRDTYGKDIAPVFARIDVIRDAANTLFVNSVELVDPVLFFSKANGAARTFVTTVADYVRSVRARLGIKTPGSTTPTSPAVPIQKPLYIRPSLLPPAQNQLRPFVIGGESSTNNSDMPPRLFDLMPVEMQRQMGAPVTANPLSLFPPIANASIKQNPPLFQQLSPNNEQEEPLTRQ